MSVQPITRPLHTKLPFAVKVEFRQHYRLLLREASYLPHPRLKDFWTSHIKRRYRLYHFPNHFPKDEQNSGAKNVNATNFARSSNNGKQMPTAERAASLLKVAQLILRHLCRANEGRWKDLLFVLRHAYGRVGPRKYELLAPYLDEEAPSNDLALKELVEGFPAKPETNTVPEISTAIRAIATLQLSQSVGQLRRIDPVIPETNSWGRPMPLKRVKNMKIKAYNILLNRIMAPLPRAEWEQLRDLSFGKDRIEGRRKRRSGWENNELQRSKFLEAGKTTSETVITSPRAMQRAFRTVFAQCPTIRRDSSSGEWNVEWGTGISFEIPEGEGEESRHFFEGVDDDQLTIGHWSEINRNLAMKANNQPKNKDEYREL